jgi:hypothetical protein
MENHNLMPTFLNERDAPLGQLRFQGGNLCLEDTELGVGGHAKTFIGQL